MIDFLRGLFVCQSFVFLSSFWSAITLCRQMHCQYNESVHQKEQLVGRINTITYFFYFIHVHFCEAMDSMQYRPSKTNQEVSNTNHFGSVSDSLGQLASASECMASTQYNTMQKILWWKIHRKPDLSSASKPKHLELSYPFRIPSRQQVMNTCIILCNIKLLIAEYDNRLCIQY